MDYLVSFSIRGFVDTWSLHPEPQFQRVGDEGGQMRVMVTEAWGKYGTEINDESEAIAFGEIVSSFIADDHLNLTLLHFNTFVVSWNGTEAELKDIIMNRLSPYARVIMARIDGPVITNFKQDSWLKS